MKSMPVPIRAFFASGKIDDISKNLMQKYQLHIDTSTIVERELILLLLGLKNPTEFSMSLQTEAAIPAATVQSIMADINQQVFVPLQAEMRRGANQATPPAPTAPKVQPSPQIPKVEPFSQSPRPAPSDVRLPPKFAMPVAAGAPSPLRMAIEKALPIGEMPQSSKVEPRLRVNLPGAIPSTAIPEIRPLMQIPKVEPQKTVAPAKPYSVDPYREPLQ